MRVNKRTRRGFQPMVDALEGRLVLSSVGAAAAHAASVHHMQVQEARHLRQQHRLELRLERQMLRQEHHAALHARSVFTGGGSNAGAMSIVLGTPSQRPSTSSSSGATSGSSLVVHSLAPNNLAAANT